MIDDDDDDDDAAAFNKRVLEPWKFRKTRLQASGNSIDTEHVRKQFEKFAGYVEYLVIHGFGNAILSFMHMAPALEELTLSGVSLSKPEAIEAFFATTTSLKKLTLNNVKIVGNQTAVKAVAGAFHRGLSRNLTLENVKFVDDYFDDGPLLRECLLGLLGHQHVLEASLTLLSNKSKPSDATLATLRAFLSGTKSVQKLNVVATMVLVAEMFLGLATTSSIQEVAIEAQFQELDSLDDDTRLASAIQEFCAKNNSLRKLHLVGSQYDNPFGPQESRKAFSNALAQLKSLQELNAHGLSSSILLHVPKMKVVSLHKLESPDWRLLRRGMQNMQPASTLQVLDLSGNRLSTGDLEMILPCLSRVSGLSLSCCRITFDSVPALCRFIRTTPLKKLDLSRNDIGPSGVARVFESARRSTSLQDLDMEDTMRDVYVVEDRDIIECHRALRELLAGGQLVSLNFAQEALESPLDRDTIQSLAAGLPRSQTLKTITLSGFRFYDEDYSKTNFKFLGILGEALTQTRSVESLLLNVTSVCLGIYELSEEDEEAMISFIGMMPRMKSLTCIKELFEFIPSNRVTEALIDSLQENTVLKEIAGYETNVNCNPEHICNNKTVQFYLELNRLGRDHYVAALKNKNPIPVAILPHLYARLSDPEHASHLYYFLRDASPDMLARKVPGLGKRAVATN